MRNLTATRAQVNVRMVQHKVFQGVSLHAAPPVHRPRCMLARLAASFAEGLRL